MCHHPRNKQETTVQLISFEIVKLKIIVTEFIRHQLPPAPKCTYDYNIANIESCYQLFPYISFLYLHDPVRYQWAERGWITSPQHQHRDIQQLTLTFTPTAC